MPRVVVRDDASTCLQCKAFKHNHALLVAWPFVLTFVPGDARAQAWSRLLVGLGVVWYENFHPTQQSHPTQTQPSNAHSEDTLANSLALFFALTKAQSLRHQPLCSMQARLHDWALVRLTLFSIPIVDRPIYLSAFAIPTCGMFFVVVYRAPLENVSS